MWWQNHLYTGGKAKLIPQISKRLPNNIDVFYDVFSGGANVAINMNAQIIKCVDINPYLIELMNYIKNMEYNELLERIEEKLDYYELSNSFKQAPAKKARQKSAFENLISARIASAIRLPPRSAGELPITRSEKAPEKEGLENDVLRNFDK